MDGEELGPGLWEGGLWPWVSLEALAQHGCHAGTFPEPGVS